MGTLRRLIKGYDPALVLPDDRFRELRMRARSPFSGRDWLLVLVIYAVLTGGAMAWFFGTEGWPRNGTFDNRTSTVIICSLLGGMFATGLFGVPLEKLRGRQRMSVARDEYVAYWITKSGWRPPRGLIALVLLMGLCLAICSAGLLTMGERIDDNGILHSDWPNGHVLRDYTEVASVGVYDSGIHVTFKDGDVWKSQIKAETLPEYMEHARFIADRAGIKAYTGAANAP